MLLKEKLKSYLAIILAITIWGTFPSILKITLNDLNIISVIAIRFVFSSILLLYLCPGILRKRKSISIKLWICFFMVIEIMFYLQTMAVKDIPVSWYVVIFSTCPILMAICLRYKFSYIAILGIIIVIISMLKFVSLDTNNSYHVHFLQIVILLLGMLSWVIYSILIKKFHSSFNDLEITAITYYAGAIIYMPMFFLSGSITLFNWKFEPIILIIVMSIMLIMAFIFYSYGMRREPVVCIFGQYLEPIFGLIASFLLLNDKISLKQVITVVFIISGTILVMRYTTKSVQTISKSYP